jgi:hypothetical protein
MPTEISNMTKYPDFNPRLVFDPKPQVVSTLKQARVVYSLIVDAMCADKMHPCQHGHLNCSYVQGGPCVDELLANFPELDE